MNPLDKIMLEGISEDWIKPIDIPETYKFRGFEIPEYMMGGIERYIEHGIEPGDFLTAVICNDLAEAVGRADDTNIRNIPAYLGYLYNEAPSPCWGSPAKFKAWMKMKRVKA